MYLENLDEYDKQKLRAGWWRKTLEHFITVARRDGDYSKPEAFKSYIAGLEETTRFIISRL